MGGSSSSGTTTPDIGATTILGDVGNVLSSAFTDPGELSEALQELNVDAGTIAKILDALGTGEDDMPRVLTAVAGTHFGNLPKGTELGLHTGNAHAFLQASVKDMLTTLGLYISGVKAFQHGTNTSDSFAASDLKRIHTVVAQATTTNDDQRHRRH